MSSISSQELADSPSDSKPQECEPSLFARLNLTAAPSCAGIGRTCRSTRTCARSTGRGIGAQSSLFAADTLASLSAWQDEGVAKKMKDISGRKCIALFERSGRDGSLPRMLLGILASASMRLPHRWKLKVSPSGRLLFQLAPLARRIGETASGLLLTSNTMDHLWPTPDVRGFTNDGALLMLKEKCRSREEWAAMAYRSGSGQKQKLWPTPNASDCRDRGNMSNPAVQRRMAKGKQLGLSMVVSESSGQLNPTWVEWLMGFPTEWSVCAPSAMPSSHKSPISSGEPSSSTNGGGS